MTLLDKMRQQKLLSLSLLLFTLVIGIVIGTLVNTGVNAARSLSVAPDATPLVIPNAVQLGNEFTKLAKKLEPSVVYITGDSTPKNVRSPRRGQSEDEEGGSGSQDDQGMDLFRRFFHGPYSGEAPPHAFRREQSGTGFITDKNGYLITNKHVVEGADRIKVRLHGDATERRAHIIGVDTETDLAILKIDGKGGLVPVAIGNSDAVQVGDWAVAIGSPFGLEASVTAGIVSATGRDIGTQQFQRFIQTDAAINPGNSGGPLLNIRGEVIGVNTMIATQSGGYQGIGFALPINMAARVYNDIVRSGRVSRGSIGIKWTKGNKPDLFRALGTNQGVIVEEVTKDGPADKAGLKDGDIVIAMNGKPVKDGEDLVTRVAESPIGSTANLTVDRDGKKRDYKVTIMDRAQVFKDDPRFAAMQPQAPEEPGKAEATQAKFGIKIRTLNDKDRDDWGLAGKRGVVVQGVDSGSLADDVGLFERDVITAINRQPVQAVEDVQRIQKALKPGDAVAFRVLRSSGAVRGGKGQWQSQWLSGTLTNP